MDSLGKLVFRGTVLIADGEPEILAFYEGR